MKRNEWYWIPWYLVALVLCVLKIWFPGVLPERVDMLPFIMVALVCVRNLATALGNPDEEKEEPRWNKFWILWGFIGLAVVAFCFIVYAEVNLVMTLWIAVTMVISIAAYISYRHDVQEL